MKQTQSSPELEKRLAQAVARTAPDNFGDILSRCEARKGNVIPMTEVTAANGTRKKAALRGLIAACLALILAGGGGGGFYYWQTHAVATVVSLDVNPSIELKINAKERILSCTPLNEDAAMVLFEMDGGADLEGAKLDVAVNALVGALVRHGYLEDISSAILISVEDKDQTRAVRLQEKLAGTVDSALQAQSSGAAVLSQNLTKDAGLNQLAQANHISAGKAAMVEQAIAQNSTLEFQPLAALSVEELKQLLEMGAPAMPIGVSAAQQAAEKHAGTLEVDAVTSKVEPELDENPAHYEVTLYHPVQGEFEYKVDAYTGKILSGQENILSSAAGNAGTSLISETQAWNAALEHCGRLYPELQSANAIQEEQKLKWEDGRQVYDIDFWISGYDFDYEIDASTGAVLDWDTDYTGVQAPAAAPVQPNTPAQNTTPVQPSTPAPSDPPPVSTSAPSAPAAQSYIGETAARQAALTHANCQEGETTYCNSWLGYDDGHPECYKVEFMVGSSRYEYEIGLYDGAVIKHECKTYGHHEEHHSSHHNSGTAQVEGGTDIGQEAALSAALRHAGVSQSQIYDLEIERDWEDVCWEYEIEFESDQSKYEYKIDGSTGSILEYEWEPKNR